MLLLYQPTLLGFSSAVRSPASTCTGASVTAAPAQALSMAASLWCGSGVNGQHPDVMSRLGTAHRDLGECAAARSSVEAPFSSNISMGNCFVKAAATEGMGDIQKMECLIAGPPAFHYSKSRCVVLVTSNLNGSHSSPLQTLSARNLNRSPVSMETMSSVCTSCRPSALLSRIPMPASPQQHCWEPSDPRPKGHSLVGARLNLTRGPQCVT